MAPTEMTAKPKQPESSKVDDKHETVQNRSTDPSTTGHTQQSTTNPAIEETLRETSPNWEYVSNRVLITHN